MMSSLYIGATGMKTQGEGMNVVSNNLANVNTVGFKKTLMQYHDLISQTMPSGSNYKTNLSQVGMGAMVADTKKIFKQGGIEAGSAVTDLAIEGKGFFGVQKNGQTHYTRAGNFRFNYDGQLLDPSGWNVLGYKITNGQRATEPSIIDLDLSDAGIGSFPPKASTSITSILQLGKITDKTVDETNPLFSLAASYNGTSSPPLGEAYYSYSQPLQFYDSTGKLQSATIYIDYAGEHNGQTAMEYVIAMPPGEAGGNKSDGLLMAGNMFFSSTGEITNITAYSPPSGDPANLSGWTAAPLKNGHPALNVAPPGARPQTIALDFGITLSGKAQPATAAEANGLPLDDMYAADPDAVVASTRTTKRGTSNAMQYMTTDGYPEGELKDITISADGTMRGVYTNNQVQDLYQFTLFRFTSEDGLRREGNNHFSGSDDVGNITHGVPQHENFGSLSPWSLETSNVEYSEEFATMIITQRAFQMNSKVVTTSDMMLQKAMELKRS